MASATYLDSLIWSAIIERNLFIGDNKLTQEFKLFDEINKLLKRDVIFCEAKFKLLKVVYMRLNDMYKNYYNLSQEGEFSVNSGRFSNDFYPVKMSSDDNCIDGYIGEGMFGKVYKVKHKIDDQLYAIKKIDLQSE